MGGVGEWVDWGVMGKRVGGWVGECVGGWVSGWVGGWVSKGASIDLKPDW